jgi:hypothetical protein
LGGRACCRHLNHAHLRRNERHTHI